MKRTKVLAVLMVGVFLALLPLNTFAAGSKEGNAPAADTKKAGQKTTVGLIALAFGTQSFNDDVLAGLKEAEAKLNVKAMPLEVLEVADTANSLRTLISQGATFIIVPSAEYKDGMLEVAKENPKVHFLYVTEPLTGIPNIMSISYRENEAAFLAGALGALLSKSQNIGAVLAIGDVVQYRYQYGFMAGAKAINSKCQVQTAFTNSYKDINKGKEVAGVMYSKGADFVGTYAGACNLGVFAAAKDAGDGKFCFGAANGQFDKMPDKIVASVVKPIDKAIFTILKEYTQEGKFESQTTRSLGLKEGGVNLLYTPEAALASKVPADVRATIEDLRKKIETGALKVPGTEDEYKAFNYTYKK